MVLSIEWINRKERHMRQIAITVMFLALTGCYATTDSQRLTAFDGRAAFVFELHNDGEGTCNAELEGKAVYAFQLLNDGAGTCTLQQ